MGVGRLPHLFYNLYGPAGYNETANIYLNGVYPERYLIDNESVFGF